MNGLFNYEKFYKVTFTCYKMAGQCDIKSL